MQHLYRLSGYLPATLARRAFLTSGITMTLLGVA